MEAPTDEQRAEALAKQWVAADPVTPWRLRWLGDAVDRLVALDDATDWYEDALSWLAVDDLSSLTNEQADRLLQHFIAVRRALERA